MNEDEKRVVSKMIKIYCRAKHHESGKLCSECSELKIYVNERLEKCPFQDNKPTCNSCSIHCYKKDRRAQIKEVMRFAGPRMLIFSPIDAIIHFHKEYKRNRIFKSVNKNQ